MRKARPTRKVQPRHFPKWRPGQSTQEYVRAYYQLNTEFLGSTAYKELIIGGKNA